MPGVAQFQMRGYAELEKRLATLGPKIARRVLRKAVDKAATPIVQSAKQRVPAQTGLLRIAIGKKTKMYTRSRTAVAIIGARTKFRSKLAGRWPKRKPANYAHLVEFGTRPHKMSVKRFRVAGGAWVLDDQEWTHPGTAARPFLRPAFASNRYKALGLIGREVWLGIERESKR